MEKPKISTEQKWDFYYAQTIEGALAPKVALVNLISLGQEQSSFSLHVRIELLEKVIAMVDSIPPSNVHETIDEDMKFNGSH